MTVLDAAYETLSGTGYEFGGGLSNHGPMAAEALLQLGFPDELESWVASYLPRLSEDVPRPVEPLLQRGRHLGEFLRVADWTDAAAVDLADRPWRQVLAEWVPMLAPGAVAAAGHGLIRTAHAVRSLTAQETPARLAELAAGLGYWAARWQRLPGSPELTGPESLPQALRSLPSVPADRRGLITQGLLMLDAVPAFGAAVDSLGTADADLERLLSAVSAAAARAMVGSPVRLAIGLVHAVTVPAAVRLLLPALPATQHRVAVAAAWQASAALLSTTVLPRRVAEGQQGASWDELAERAVRTGDEHALKYVEACRREDALAPDPAYGVAAETFLTRADGR